LTIRWAVAKAVRLAAVTRGRLGASWRRAARRAAAGRPAASLLWSGES